jgi:hypothetical protein
MMRIAIAALLLVIVVVPGHAAGEDEKRALDALKKADGLIYRPLDEGLKDISFEFSVETSKGKMNCRYMYRAATDDMQARERKTITNLSDRKERRTYAASLDDHFHLASMPILMPSLLAEAEGMKAEWKGGRGGMTILTPKKEDESTYSRIAFVWNEDGLPREISWHQMKEDPDEGKYRVELVATYEWKKQGKGWVVSMMNSNRTGSRMVASYSYETIRGIVVPSVVKKINPFSGEDEMKFEKVRVNEGISDDEFSKWY